MTERAPDRRPRPRPGRCPDGDRPHADPVGPLPATAISTGSAPPRRARGSSPCRMEGLADGPLDDVEVLLRGWLAADAFDRLLARAPRLAWVHSASAGVERVLTPAGRGARPRHHERPRRVQPPDRRVRPDDDPGDQPPAAPAARAPARADLAAARGRASCATSPSASSASGRSGARSGRSRRPSAAGSSRPVGGPMPGRAPAIAPGRPPRATRAGRSARPCSTGCSVRRDCRSSSPSRTSSSWPRRSPRRRRTSSTADTLAAREARRLAHQRRPRPARRRARAPPGAPGGPARWRRPRRVPRGAAAADVALLRPAERDRHAPHVVVERAGSSIGASSCSATTSAASPPGSRSLNVVDPAVGY